MAKAWRVAAVALSIVVAGGAVRGLLAADETKSGIYVETAAADAKDGPKRLSGNMPKMDTQVGVGAAFGFGKPKVTTIIAGDKASLRAAADGTFLFVFGAGRDPRAMPDPSAMMGMLDELPPHTSSPKDYALIRMAVVEGDRAWDSKKGEQVKCLVEKLGPKQFRIKPERALVPGEYAFTNMQSGYAGMLWDFGVD